MNDNLLILFIRNAVDGKVHPSIIRLVGESNALETYLQMLQHLRDISSTLPAEKLVLYSDFIETGDVFEEDTYGKEMQSGGDTGSRLADAFKSGFERGYKRVVLVMGECSEMSRSHIVEAFENMKETSVVVGPAEEGGYYLLGMNKYVNAFFEGKDWNGEDVFLDTILDIQKLDLPFRLLDTLPAVSQMPVHHP
ncbi:MAG TPA: DUF2064 domain-containing protein [Bacteroidia bacterium]|nr:DUF2064 domain-containing protein [Bacteroidia bacterium]